MVVGDAIDALHGRNVIRGGLKPPNVILGRSPQGERAVIMDERLEGGKPEEFPVGILAYSVPEQNDGRSSARRDRCTRAFG